MRKIAIRYHEFGHWQNFRAHRLATACIPKLLFPNQARQYTITVLNGTLSHMIYNIVCFDIVSRRWSHLVLLASPMVSTTATTQPTGTERLLENGNQNKTETKQKLVSNTHENNEKKNANNCLVSC